MIPGQLSKDERSLLLKMARQALEQAVQGEIVEPLDLETLPPSFQEDGATFVTLTIQDDLRGCIGALEAYQPLAEDVREHAIAAALQDFRFPPVEPSELSQIKIEISRLSRPQPLEYKTPEDLLKLLRPNIDGVILRDGFRRATFLPQVWEKISDPALFLSYLCQKMGSSPDAWKQKKLEVSIYQVEEFCEER